MTRQSLERTNISLLFPVTASKLRRFFRLLLANFFAGIWGLEGSISRIESLGHFRKIPRSVRTRVGAMQSLFEVANITEHSDTLLGKAKAVLQELFP